MPNVVPYDPDAARLDMLCCLKHQLVQEPERYGCMGVLLGGSVQFGSAGWPHLLLGGFTCFSKWGGMFQVIVVWPASKTGAPQQTLKLFPASRKPLPGCPSLQTDPTPFQTDPTPFKRVRGEPFNCGFPFVSF